jgi:hypothetical protein
MTEHPTQNMYSADYGIQAYKRRACSAHIMAIGTVGGIGRKKPMRVSIGVQDHAGRWHKLVFRGLRETTFRANTPQGEEFLGGPELTLSNEEAHTFIQDARAKGLTVKPFF